MDIAKARRGLDMNLGDSWDLLEGSSLQTLQSVVQIQHLRFDDSNRFLWRIAFESKNKNNVFQVSEDLERSTWKKFRIASGSKNNGFVL